MSGSPSTVKVACLGWYGKHNCGDEAYKLAFPRLFPGFNFNFTDKLPEDCDIVIVGGGDVLTRHFTSQLSGVRKPVYAISITASESIKQNVFCKVLARDTASLRNLKVDGIEAEYCPDITFTLEADRQNGGRLIKRYFADRDRYQKVVGVVVNANLMADPGRNRSFLEGLEFAKFSYDLGRLMDSTSASFIFIPFGTQQPWDDRAANGYAVSNSKFWQKTTVVYDRLSVQDTLDLVSACDAVISTRLHSSIFSCVAEVPFIDILHNHKNTWFLDTINYQEYGISLRNFDFTQAHSLLNDILFNPTPHLLTIKMINREQREILKGQVERCMCAMTASES